MRQRSSRYDRPAPSPRRASRRARGSRAARRSRSAPPALRATGARRRPAQRHRDSFGGELIIAISVLLLLASIVGVVGGRDAAIDAAPVAGEPSDEGAETSESGRPGPGRGDRAGGGEVQATVALEPGDCEARTDRLLAAMSDEEKAGQMVMPSVALDGSEAVSAETRSLIEEYHAGSFVSLEERDPASAAEHNAQQQEWASATRLAIPLLTAADFEFGASQTVASGSTVLPLQMALGASGDPSDAAAAARITAEEARAMGFNWVLAPVADVSTGTVNPVIGVRSFGEDPELVATMTAEQVRAYEEAGVLAAPKHFPGHGATAVDSHLRLPRIQENRATLDRVHLAPFQAAVDAGADAIMTGHLVVESVDRSLPATLSPDVLNGVLREEMGYDGIIVTDAMNMAAVDRRWSVQEAAVMAVQAGADIILSPGTYEEHVARMQALVGALASGELTQERVDESVRRILKVKCEYGLFQPQGTETNPSAVGSEDHVAEARQLAVDGVTMLENNRALPLSREKGATYLFAGVMDVAPMAERAEALTDAEILAWQSSGENPTATEVTEAQELAAGADALVVTTYSYGEPSFSQVRLVEALIDTRKPVIVVSLGVPHDIASFPSVDAYLATYARAAWPHPNSTAAEAAVDVIFGEEPGGRLPVQIEGLYRAGRGLDY